MAASVAVARNPDQASYLAGSQVELRREGSAAVRRPGGPGVLDDRLVADRRHARQAGERDLDAAGQILARQLGDALEAQARGAVQQLLLRRLREKIPRYGRTFALFSRFKLSLRSQER